ncbi:MAG TPA: hypothetical protein PK485_07830, partial [Bacteroidales bacterium]|jgi:hypothetical protein|nr:hypothetical protein [Bacteroidales bacterium]
VGYAFGSATAQHQSHFLAGRTRLPLLLLLLLLLLLHLLFCGLLHLLQLLWCRLLLFRFKRLLLLRLFRCGLLLDALGRGLLLDALRRTSRDGCLRWPCLGKKTRSNEKEREEDQEPHRHLFPQNYHILEKFLHL